MRQCRLVLPLLLMTGVLALPAAGQGASGPLTGIADQNPAMFTSSLYQQLPTTISRYIAPYDLATYTGRNTAFLNTFRLWYARAKAQNIKVLVAFYHSEITTKKKSKKKHGRAQVIIPKMPSVATYAADVKKFINMFPDIKDYQPWNEANRGNIRGVLNSPTARQAAAYYKALAGVGVCQGCQIAGLDVLDGQSIAPTVRYIHAFKAAVGPNQPSFWGLHNYSDTNRSRTSGTKAVLAATGTGELWLTETGGVVKFGGAFPNKCTGKGARLRCSGTTRAAKALQFMFARLTTLSPRITRLYIFQWSGASSRARFDAGLIGTDGRPRPGYVVVCRKLAPNPKTCDKIKTTPR